jgi:hypothetical protein
MEIAGELPRYAWWPPISKRRKDAISKSAARLSASGVVFSVLSTPLSNLKAVLRKGVDL